MPAALLLALATGLWVLPPWWRADLGDERRTLVHGLSAGAVLLALLLNLDNHAAGHGLALLAGFFALATGMLLFLMRQRQRRFPRPLLLLHGGLAIAALGLAGVLVV